MRENIAILTLVVMSGVMAGFVVKWVRGTVIVARRRLRDLCVFCGYSHRGNITGICPECGRRVSQAA
jgi:hypothetical protein